jgi:hypothetical protein
LTYSERGKNTKGDQRLSLEDERKKEAALFFTSFSPGFLITIGFVAAWS